MSTPTREQVLAALGPKPRNVAALVSVVGLLVVGYVIVPHWATRYGASLLAFSIWMIWFVLVVVELLDIDTDEW